jgi:hypothetical protein
MRANKVMKITIAACASVILTVLLLALVFGHPPVHDAGYLVHYENCNAHENPGCNAYENPEQVRQFLGDKAPSK